MDEVTKEVIQVAKKKDRNYYVMQLRLPNELKVRLENKRLERIGYLPMNQLIVELLDQLV